MLPVFVVFKSKTSLRCETCVAVFSDESGRDIHLLIKLNSKGFLIFPSHDVIEICLLSVLLVNNSFVHYQNTCQNRVVLLTKAVVEKYLQVRYFYAGKQYTARLCEKQKTVSCQVNTKLVIFSGQ